MKVQSFTRHLTEEDSGYAKLKDEKFRKIRYNEDEKAIMTDSSRAAIAGVSLYAEENPDDENAYYNTFSKMKTHRKGLDIKGADFEVYYSFSSSTRGTTSYGNSNWSARFLYEFLCASFNSGERFIDTYLNRVFMGRPVYRALQSMVQEIQTEILAKWKDGNLRGGQWASFYRFQESQMKYLKSLLGTFSYDVRQDIISCLSNGMIPTTFSLSPATVKKRHSLGIHNNNPFYATSWLISQLEVHIVLSNSNEGSLFYSDSYKGGP